MKNFSPLQKARYDYKPAMPKVLQNDINSITVKLGEPTESVADQTEVKGLFKTTYGAPIARFVEGTNPGAGKKTNVGVVLSGGQAPGGHNVIAGLFDAIKAANPESKLYGFLGGPSGLVDKEIKEITAEFLADYRNTGGFDIIGSGRTKLESEEQYKQSLQNCRDLGITTIIIIGGDDSNTNGAVLAEYFKANDAGVNVIGCPKTIDGDLKNEYIETSFGFDTATKTYSELIGNIERDVNSAKKYWHFIKLMGRSASHIGLECALQTQPNIAFISEEVEANNRSLLDVVKELSDAVIARAKAGKNFGVVLVPEGLIEFIPEMGKLISELNNKLAANEKYYNTLSTFEDQREWVNKELSKDSSYVFSALPRLIQQQLLMDRDPHGNVQVSRIETEKLLIEMVSEQVNEYAVKEGFDSKFSALAHFFGYEGRCGAPSNFDANYCYALGYSAYILAMHDLTGYISNVADLQKSANEWVAGGVPLTMMMNMEQRHGEMKPVIKKALVELDGKPFKTFAAKRGGWLMDDAYLFPGAIQYYGPDEVCNRPTETLLLEKN